MCWLSPQFTCNICGLSPWNSKYELVRKPCKVCPDFDSLAISFPASPAQMYRCRLVLHQSCRPHQTEQNKKRKEHPTHTPCDMYIDRQTGKSIQDEPRCVLGRRGGLTALLLTAYACQEPSNSIQHSTIFPKATDTPKSCACFPSYSALAYGVLRIFPSISRAHVRGDLARVCSFTRHGSHV